MFSTMTAKSPLGPRQEFVFATCLFTSFWWIPELLCIINYTYNCSWEIGNWQKSGKGSISRENSCGHWNLGVSTVRRAHLGSSSCFVVLASLLSHSQGNSAFWAACAEWAGEPPVLSLPAQALLCYGSPLQVFLLPGLPGLQLLWWRSFCAARTRSSPFWVSSRAVSTGSRFLKYRTEPSLSCLIFWAPISFLEKWRYLSLKSTGLFLKQI